MMHGQPNIKICISGFPELRNGSYALRFKFVSSVKCFVQCIWRRTCVRIASLLILFHLTYYLILDTTEKMA
jgi:hypothetical protein